MYQNVRQFSLRVIAFGTLNRLQFCVLKNHLILFLQEIGLLERDVTLRNFNSCQQQLTLIH